MANIDILAVREDGGHQVGCGSRECANALEAVMQELIEKPADTAGSVEIGAVDDWMAVSACKVDGGYEVHVHIGTDDSWFTFED